MEIITGVERRRRWRVEDKLQIVAETEQPDACFAEIARRHEISRGLLWNWRSQLRRGKLIQRSAAGFLPVQVVHESVAPDLPPRSLIRSVKPSGGSDGKIEITLPDGSHLQVGNDVSLAALRRVMTALRG
ncbi:MAG: transposase [Pseudomonadota bacterium]|nr:transposase [Pseudomonadota bacterium]